MFRTGRRRVRQLGFSIVILIGLAACKRATKIGDILTNPQKYSRQAVRIRGRVGNVLQLPFLATKVYSVQDDSGEVKVRTETNAPLVGSMVEVRGVLDTVAVIGEQRVGLHLKEIERH